MSNSDLMNRAPIPRLRAAAVASGMFGPGPVTVARAPGRLDVMGGIADYTGSLVCEMPLAVAAGVVVQARSDHRVVCRSIQSGSTAETTTDALQTADPLAVRGLFGGDRAWARYPVGCAWWLMRNRAAVFTGLTILIDSDVPLGGGVSSSAAIEVATMTALASLVKISLDPLDLAVACQVVENLVVGAPCGVMDQVTSSMGVEGAMLEILCQPRRGTQSPPAQVLGQVRVPRGYAFIGIHSGVSHEVSGDPYTDTRVAAFMGQKILSTRFPKQIGDVYLANVDRAVYERELRAALPEELAGDAFAREYGKTNDPVTSIRPATRYRVRAATDHHVFEMGRVTRFVACIKSASPDAIREAGQLMYESHRSYGDCANLGHAMTDLIVEMAKRLGAERGVYGAKITGGGGGGTVALLIRDDADARRLLEQLQMDYSHQTGRATICFAGSSPGAAALGTLAVPFEGLR
ncbi:MAG: GHMP kinase [Planctomycetes bacterium]|nr:GHMP kinase [Planctomycetota bacterium]